MKNKQIQIVSGRHFAMGLGLMALLGAFSVPTWTRQMDEAKALAAKQHAEVLGYQVFEIYKEAAHNASAIEHSAGRSPASLRAIDGDVSGLREGGSIGSDPWGQPYRYKILSAIGDQMRVQIWSAGPNGRFETADQPGEQADTYIGDDVGIILALNQRAVAR